MLIANHTAFSLPRRELIAGALAITGTMLAGVARAQGVATLEQFGGGPGADNTLPMQRALDWLAERGGGTLRIGGRYRAGVIVVRGDDIFIDGAGGTLVDARLVIAPGAKRLRVSNLELLETRRNPESYLLDVSGQDCSFDTLRLVKRPMAGGYQGYVRQSSARCRFTNLRLHGSNGLFVAGRDHVFDGFDFTSTLQRGMGGDDAFAIKGAGAETSGVTIRNGVVRGFSAVVSIGSEVGFNREHPQPGSVRGVRVSNVVGDRCAGVAFIKPGALIYDWRGGVVADVVLDTITLSDPGGFMFASGIAISVGRGARVSGFTARNIVIRARARSQGVLPTAAVDLAVRDVGGGGLIENVDIQVDFDGRGAQGYSVDHIVRMEKDNPARGAMRNVTIDVQGTESRIGGIYVGAGLDDALTIRRARLARVAINPPASLGAGGVWADSRIRLEDAKVEAVSAPTYAGRAAP